MRASVQDGETNMLKSMRTLAATAFVAAGLVSTAGVASAVPLAGGLALDHAARSSVETVQWRAPSPRVREGQG
jgi:hypothetical protein